VKDGNNPNARTCGPLVGLGGARSGQTQKIYKNIREQLGNGILALAFWFEWCYYNVVRWEWQIKPVKTFVQNDENGGSYRF
jgi:hypothetical protein